MIRFIPRPWNCTPPLSGRLGLKHYPLSLAITTSSQAEGEGTRFFWIDPLPGGVPGVFPFHRSHEYPCQTIKKFWRCRLRFRVSGLPLLLTRYAFMPGSSGQQERYVCHHRSDGISVFQIVKERRAAELWQPGGQRLKRKNPGGAFRHQPGFRGNPREVPDVQVTSRILSGGLPHIVSCKIAGVPEHWPGLFTIDSYRFPA